MSKIPHEIDQLMWLVAEQQSPEALDAFGRRYPAYRGELMHRLEIIRGLKLAKPATAKAIPAFRPLYAQPRRPSRVVWALAAAACLCLISWGSYTLVWNKVRQAPQSSPPAASAVVTPQVDQGPPEPIARKVRELPRAAVATQAEAAPVTPYEKLITLKSEHTSLVRAFSDISRQSGVRLQIAPRFEDVDIACAYSGVPALKVIQELAATYGFSAFAQGDGAVLIIPAADPNAAVAKIKPPENLPMGSALRKKASTLIGPIGTTVR